MPSREPQTHGEATFAADVYPKQVVVPIAMVRRAGPLVKLSDLLNKKRKRKDDAGVYRVDEKPLRKAPIYPYSGRGIGYQGSSGMSNIYPFIVG